MKILVTGGLGFIGSHTVVELIKSNHEVYIVDDLSNSKMEVLSALKEITMHKEIMFKKIDVTQPLLVDELFKKEKFDGVIHFAGYKAVGESVSLPLKYYRNNVLSTIVLADACIKYNVNKFVFSSSATVYGDNKIPFVENMELLPTTNPYGETKAMSERILKDTVQSNPYFSVSILRYFNPVGAHQSGLIGESPNGVPNNLMPFVTQVAKGVREKLSIFGDDYPTRDGTGVRDYIHVVDLAVGHVAALEKMSEGVSVYNLGTGKGTSVLELVKTFERVNSIKILYEIVPRRAGDIPEFYADARKAEVELGWVAKRSLEDMCRDAWSYEKKSKYST